MRTKLELPDRVYTNMRCTQQAQQKGADRGWACNGNIGVVLWDTGLIDRPIHAVMGEKTLHRLSEE